MFRKFALGAALLSVGLGLCSFTSIGSYATTAFSKARSAFKGSVPVEFEIERLRNEVAQLTPDMKRNLSRLAEESVAVDNLREEIKTISANLGKQKDSLVQMSRDLEGNTNKTIIYGGVSYSADRVKQKLDRDFASYKRCEAELKTKRDLLEVKEKALDTAREQMTALRTQQQELEVAIEQLEGELKSVRLAQTKNKFQVDDTQLAQCKATLAEIRNRLNVERKTVELTGEFGNDPIPVDRPASKSSSDLAKEVKSYLGDKDVAADTK